jgi:hypothetical protein
MDMTNQPVFISGSKSQHSFNYYLKITFKIIKPKDAIAKMSWSLLNLEPALFIMTVKVVGALQYKMRESA